MNEKNLLHEIQSHLAGFNSRSNFLPEIYYHINNNRKNPDYDFYNSSNPQFTMDQIYSTVNKYPNLFEVDDASRMELVMVRYRDEDESIPSPNYGVGNEFKKPNMICENCHKPYFSDSPEIKICRDCNDDLYGQVLNQL